MPNLKYKAPINAGKKVDKVIPRYTPIKPRPKHVENMKLNDIRRKTEPKRELAQLILVLPIPVANRLKVNIMEYKMQSSEQLTSMYNLL